MKEYVTVVTRKGQVTIPAEIREALGLTEGDAVAWVIEKGQVRLSRSESIVSRTAGALRSDVPALTPEEERQATEEAIAQDAAQRMGS